MRTPVRRQSSDPHGERGAVMVLVAVTLPVLALFVAFAIDVSHWFDYSRNLQNRADAAALAAGLEYGGTCLVSNPSAGAMTNIGQFAQNYSGAASNSDLYYPFAGAANEKNVPNLTAGTLNHFHFLINSQNYWQKGQSSATQSFTMGSPSTVCSSLDEDGNRGPFVDIKLSQDSLPLFLPLFGIRPTITAHARVSLEQGTSETNIRPLAVRDDAATPCVSVKLVYASGPNAGQTFKTITLSKDGTGDPNFPTAILWDNPAGTAVTMPSGASLSDLYVQPFLNNCSGSGTNYDSASGLNWINVYGTSTPSNGQAPVITGTAAAGGVFLTGCSIMSGAYNQYFTSPTACNVGITANVAFAPNVPLANQTVKAVDSVDGTSYTLTNVAGTTQWTIGPANGPLVTPGDGQHAFDIQATQTAGSINNGTTACGDGHGHNPNPCVTDFGTKQQGFGACNGCGNPDESGPIVALRTRLAGSNPQSSGQNVFQAGTSKNLVFEVAVQGLNFDSPGQKATVLRFGVSTDPSTGLVNCGQGGGASADANAITFGCPLYGQPSCNDTNFCAPMKIYNAALHPNGICNPELRQTANPAYTDCVQATPGTRRSKIPGAIGGLIVKQNVCSPNHWPEYSGNPTTYSFPPGDPRAITMIITSPTDLSNNNVVPIRNFATFYVTGWDTSGSNPNCNRPQPGNPPALPPPAGGYGNEAFPGTGKKNSKNGAIWGHWIMYTDPNAGGSGTFCNPSSFGICAPVLSR
jgi:Flp pilus assembly protein TadG